MAVGAIVSLVVGFVVFDLYPGPADISFASYDVPERTLRLGVGTCNATHFVSTEESAEAVVITVRSVLGSADDCQDRVEVRLDDPLGERAVVDGSDGELVRASR